jgi:putative thioredoxin
MNQNFSRPGAIDLSALRKPAGGAPSGTPGAQRSGGYVLDVTEQSFQPDVIERSLQHPVVVEFWSPRSAASTDLGAVLQGLSDEYQGKFLLARIDVDANPALAQAVGVQAVPLVIAVLRGQVVPLFQGTVDEAQARQYLDQLLTVAVANGITGRADPVAAAASEEPTVPADERYGKAEDALAAGDLDGAVAAYQRLLDENPGDAVAKAGIARAKLVQRTRDVPADVRKRAADDPSDVQAQIAVADLDLVGGHVDDAFGRLIRAVQSTTGADRDAARLHLLELFDVVGPDDERVTKARKQLMAALF